MTITTKEQIRKQIADLNADVLIATDEGTHGMPDTVRQYESLNGTKYANHYHGGAFIGRGKAESEHGRMRTFSHKTASQRRREIAELAKIGRREKDAAIRREQLARGWDGYQFIGVEAGQQKLAAMGEPAIIV